MRLKTRTAQLTAEGTYRGGTPPFGYRAVHKGRMNKKGQPVKDLEIEPQEAEYVKMIFSKTLNEGYGSYRMADCLNKLGIRIREGKDFQCNTINRILKNRIYCGYLVAGETVSPKQEHLAIIDENDFDSVQHILKQRSKKNDEKQHIAWTTKGKTLLLGNIYCAHCGSHLTSTESKDTFVRKDGTIAEMRYWRYMCYHKLRKLNECDGQSIYTAKRIDEVVLDIVRHYLSEIKKTPKDKALEIRYQKELSLDVGKCLCGDSIFFC